MKKIKISVLSYNPSFITDESINVGILFHCLDNDFRKFEVTKNWKRLESFDDEINIEFTKLILSGIKDGIEVNLFNSKKFNIENFTRFYVNEFKFSKVHLTETENIDEFIEQTNKIYLKYNYEKSKRLKKKEELSYMKNYLRGKNINYNNLKIVGKYNDNVKYDYIVNEYGIKLFEFKENSIHLLVNQAKIWAFNAEEFKNTHKTIITYTMDSEFDLNNIHFRAIKEIFSNSKVSNFLEFDECLTFLSTLENKK